MVYEFVRCEGYSKIIQSFARDTPERLKFGDFNHTINSYDWLYPWFEQYFLKTEFLYISILLLLLNLIIILFTFFYKKNNFPISINFYLITLFIFLLIFIFGLRHQKLGLVMEL